MVSFRRLCKTVAFPMAVVIFLASMPIDVARAGIVPTERVLSSASQTRESIAEFLARDDVRQQMRMLGVDPAEAEARVAALSDEEVANLAERLPVDPAGQSALGVVIGAALVIFVVLLITDILGLTKVFPFTRSVR